MHRFQTYRRHPGRDGANFAYEEIVRLLEETPEIATQAHNVVSLFDDDGAAFEALQGCDAVVSTIGPHSYIYFFLRERLGLDYRIVRDVRTALWNGYLLQEALVAPYLRPGDAVFYSSAYSRDLFRALFPAVPHESQHICYPLVRWFPRTGTRAGKPGRPKTIGFVGRLTSDKNFGQALDLLRLLEQRKPGRFRLLAVGQGVPPYGASYVSERLGGCLRAYAWSPPVPPGEIWRYLKQFDVLFFPSTSTIETFGRAVVEAAHAGVPVLASSHGACPELLEPQAMLPTAYNTRQKFTTHFAAPLGEVDVNEAARRLFDDSVPRSRAHELYRDDDDRFIKAVLGGSPGPKHTGACRELIDRVVMRDLFTLQREQSDREICRLRRLFVALHRTGPSYAWALLQLVAQSRYKRKTLSFVRRSLFAGEDFTNIGGIDLEFAHCLRFYPWFEIARPADAPP